MTDTDAPPNGVQLTQYVFANVERLRAAQGLTLSEIAHAAGVTRQYLYILRSTSGGKRRRRAPRRGRPRLRRHKRPLQERVISLDVLARLACALDVKIDELLRAPCDA